jgi:Glycosyltransferase family 87
MMLQARADRASVSIQAIFEFAVVAICTLAFAATALAIGASLLDHNGAGNRDYVEYWAAGQQLIHHANPYDGTAIRKLELSAGFPPAAPTLYLGNPPSALLLMLPLGLVSPVTGEFLWELLLLLCLISSILLTRGMLNQTFTEHQAHKYLLMFAFAPVLTCLLAGQISLFILMGLVLFLRLHRGSPFLAGVSLWFCLLKPQMFVPFGVVLILWAIHTRNYKVFAGTAAALASSSVIATLFEPRIWSHYRLMMHEQRIDQLGLPSPSVLLRQHLYPHTFWVQCLPAIAGSLWAAIYYSRHREHWSWLEHGSLLMLVSALVAPYSWFMDQAALIPALLYGLYATRSRVLIATVALASAWLEIIALRGAGLYSFWYFWTTPLWLAWFVLATSRRWSVSVKSQSQSNQTSPAPGSISNRIA